MQENSRNSFQLNNCSYIILTHTRDDNLSYPRDLQSEAKNSMKILLLQYLKIRKQQKKSLHVQ